MLIKLLTLQMSPFSIRGFLRGGTFAEGRFPIGNVKLSLLAIILVEMREMQAFSAIEVLVLP